MSTTTDANAVGSSRTASLLVLLQLGSRIITFSLNQALLGFTTPAAFGTATIQLEPLLNTVLFLSREGIRSAIVRSASAADKQRQQQPDGAHVQGTPSSSIWKTSWIPLYAGIPLTLLGFGLYAKRAASSVKSQASFKHAVCLYGLATLLELASEPWFNRAQVDNNIKLRVSIEGTAVVARAIVTLAVVVAGGESSALLAFGLGQLVYSLALITRYVWHYRSSKISGSGRESQREDSSGLLKLAYALTKQSFVKQALTEGDKLIVSRVSPIEDQGGYALALNYGSLVARIIFQPLEESSRLFYSQQIGQQPAPSQANSKGQQEELKKEETDPAKADRQGETDNPRRTASSRHALESSRTLLQRLINLQIYLSLVFTCFCPFYTKPAMYHLLGGGGGRRGGDGGGSAGGKGRWSQTSAPRLLTQYLFLLPLLGMNGILEAFVQAVADEKQLGNMSFFLAIWSGIYCATCYFCVNHLNMKEEALIWSNAVSMLCRIVYSWNFITTYFLQRQQGYGGKSLLRGSLVRLKVTLLACLTSVFVMRWSYNQAGWMSFGGFVKHVGIGGICFLLTASAAAYSERDALRPTIERLKSRLQRAKTE